MTTQRTRRRSRCSTSSARRGCGWRGTGRTVASAPPARPACGKPARRTSSRLTRTTWRFRGRSRPWPSASTLIQRPLCFGDYAEFGDSEVLRAVPERLDPYRLAYANEYPISSMFRRSALDRVGGFTPNGYTGSSYEDWNLWMTLAESGARGVHLGSGRPTYRRRLHGERKLQSGKRRHTELYRELRREHPLLFDRLREHRRSSDLSDARKLLYPVVYGPRRRFRFERRVKSALDRLGVWTLRR